MTRPWEMCAYTYDSPSGTTDDLHIERVMLFVISEVILLSLGFHKALWLKSVAPRTFGKSLCM